MDESTDGSALAILERLRTGELTSARLIDDCIARIEARNPALNAVVATDFERAREGAEAHDDARARGEDLGPLHGLPITVKDSFETGGIATTSGAPELRDHVPERDAVAVRRLVAAGAILLGKTNLPLYAGDWQSFNAVYGRTNNPWDVTRTVGGSSGGSAAAIAAGLVPLELGSDIAGSIRIPAHYCGVYGHKPSHGIVPTRGHIPGPPGSRSEPDLAVAGPLARSAGDLRLALDVIAGPDALESSGWKLALPESRADRLEDFRVGYWLDDPLCPIDTCVRSELEATIEALRPHVRLVDLSLPFRLEDILPAYLHLLVGVVAADMPKALASATRLLRPALSVMDRLGFGTDIVKKSAVEGMHLSHSDWMRANEARTRLRWQCHALFEEVDVLLTPVSPVCAFPHQTGGSHLTRKILVDGKERPYLDHFSWIALATSAYLPATSAPVGIGAEGLPVNVQIVGAQLADHTTIRFAERLAEVRGGFVKPADA